MKDVTTQVVTQVRIFPPDWIPYRQLTSGEGVALFKDVMSFRGTGIEAGDMIFEGGSIDLEGQPKIQVHQVQVNDRRVILRVLGSSEDGNATFYLVSRLFNRLRGVEREDSPQILLEETASVATFDFGWEDLVSSKVEAFAKTLLEQPEFAGTNPFLRSFSLRMQIGFLETEALKARGITLSDKVLTLESRTDTPLKERLFVFGLPFSSARHGELAAKFEKSLARPKKK